MAASVWGVVVGGLVAMLERLQWGHEHGSHRPTSFRVHLRVEAEGALKFANVRAVVCYSFVVRCVTHNGVR